MICIGNLKYTMRYYEKEELYDLEKDPDEMHSEIDNSACAEQIEQMKMQLLHWY